MDLNHLCMGCMADKGNLDVCPVCGGTEGQLPDSPLQLPQGTVLNESYVLGNVLGQGGFGITYIAWDFELERRVAVKEYFPHSIAIRSSDRTTVSIYGDKHRKDFEFGLERFFNEGKALARFQEYPGIVSVLNSFQANGTGYIVMEYVEGITFKEYLRQEGGKIPFDTAVGILVPVMDALRRVHAAGLMHRDISPDNIYLTESSQVKLLDFGSARYTFGEHSENYSVILKPGYAPEEQYKTNGKQGPWTDVYSLGAVFYRAITGETPPPAMDRLDKDNIRPLSFFSAGVPVGKEAVIMKALALRAKNRYQNIEALQEELAPVQITDKEIPQSRTNESKPSMVWTAATVVFFIISIFLLIGWRKAGKDIEGVKTELRLERSQRTELEKKIADVSTLNKLLVEKGQISITGIQLRNATFKGNKLSDSNKRFKKNKIQYLWFYAFVHNNWEGIKDLKGKLGIKYLTPKGSTLKASFSTGGYSLHHQVDCPTYIGVSRGFGGEKQSFFTTTGTYRIEFWWNEKKIEEIEFEVYE